MNLDLKRVVWLIACWGGCICHWTTYCTCHHMSNRRLFPFCIISTHMFSDVIFVVVMSAWQWEVNIWSLVLLPLISFRGSMTAPFPFPIPAWTIASHQPQPQMFQNIHVLKTMPTARRKLSGMTIPLQMWFGHDMETLLYHCGSYHSKMLAYGLHEMWLVVSSWDSDRLQWGQSCSKLKWSGPCSQTVRYLWNEQSLFLHIIITLFFHWTKCWDPNGT